MLKFRITCAIIGHFVIYCGNIMFKSRQNLNSSTITINGALETNYLQIKNALNNRNCTKLIITGMPSQNIFNLICNSLIENNTRIQELEFSNQILTDNNVQERISKLTEVITKNRSLKELKFPKTSFNNIILSELDKAINKNNTLEIFQSITLNNSEVIVSSIRTKLELNRTKRMRNEVFTQLIEENPPQNENEPNTIENMTTSQYVNIWEFLQTIEQQNENESNTIEQSNDIDPAAHETQNLFVTQEIAEPKNNTHAQSQEEAMLQTGANTPLSPQTTQEQAEPKNVDNTQTMATNANQEIISKLQAYKTKRFESCFSFLFLMNRELTNQKLAALDFIIEHMKATQSNLNAAIEAYDIHNDHNESFENVINKHRSLFTFFDKNTKTTDFIEELKNQDLTNVI